MRAQINSRDIRPIENELRNRRFLAQVDYGFLSGFVCMPLPFLWDIFVVHVTFRNFLQTISVISMIRVGWVKERELRILTLVLADPFFKMGGVCRFYDESSGPVDDGCVLTRQGEDLSARRNDGIHI